MSRYFIILVLFIVVALPSKAAHEAADSTAVTQPADSLSRTLDEVVVEAETIKRDGNHDIITITREMRKNSFNTAQMLAKFQECMLIIAVTLLNILVDATSRY